MPEPPFEPYHGDESFVFVSYAHDDSEAVYADLAWLHGLGVRLWYDDGIRGGEEWADAIGRAVKRCACILVFVSPRSAASPHCRDELTMCRCRNALDQWGRRVTAWLPERGEPSARSPSVRRPAPDAGAVRGRPRRARS